MIRRWPHWSVALLTLPFICSGGCPPVTIEFPGGAITVPGVGVITLQVINDTPYDVHPRIVFDDDSGFWAGAFPSEDLATGILAPGQAVTYTFDCGKLGLLRSDEPEQFIGPFTFVADSSRTLERGEDYDCGALLQVQFVGAGEGFGVVLIVNNRVVD